jgi:hypothetical protein
MRLEPEGIGRESSFARMTHYIFTFHDSTFECISDPYHVRVVEGTMAGAIVEMAALMKDT